MGDVKIGDKFRVVKEIPGNDGFIIGDIVTVTDVDDKFLSFSDHRVLFKSRIEEGLIEKLELKEEPKLGARYNSNKLRWRNFPLFLITPLVEVAQFGETKYDTFNFLKGQTMLNSLDSLKRHLTSFESPFEPDEDHESKCNHLAHVAWNALVALYFLKTRPELDDRYKGE